jgi:tight adherence protein B
MTNQIVFLLLVMPVLSGLLLLLVRRSERRRQFVQQRLHAITVGRVSELTPQLSLIRTSSHPAVFQLPRKFSKGLDAALEAAGNRIGLLHLVAAGLIAAIIVFGFGSLIFVLNPALAMFLGGVSAVVIPVVVLRMAQAKYRSRFLDIFPDALDLLGRGVKAGLPVNEALAAAGREISDPVGSELRRALEQVQIGAQMIDALQQVADRVRVADFRFMVVALALQAKTGGSLAETLGNLSGVIRARKAIRLKARGLSAEARASIAVLAVLPFFVSGLMYFINRGLISVLFTDSRGRIMMGVAFLTLVTGMIVSTMLVKRAVRRFSI